MERFLTSLAFLFLVFQLAGQSPLEKRTDFSASNVSLERALFNLSQQAQVSISFNNNDIPAGVQVRVNVRDRTVGEILDLLLENTRLQVEVLGNQILILKGLPRKLTISGYLRDKSSGEPLIGANVYVPERNKGTITNDYGFYSLTLEEGSPRLVFSYLGYQPEGHTVLLERDRQLNLELVPSLTLKEVLVEASSFDSVTLRSSRIGTNSFFPDDMEGLPALGGEVDLMRLSYLLPGVQTGADGFGGMAVRGGNVDQNLILLDGVPVYNASHLLGVYSVFNSSAVRSAKLIKGGFPARYGGRVSSIFDIRTKEGNAKEWDVEGDIGLTSGKASVEGPIVKEKSAFFISARRSFIDLYSRPISRNFRANEGIDGEFSYYFFDLNGKVNYTFGQRDKVFFSLYHGGDDYLDERQVNELNGDTLRRESNKQEVNWGNTIASLRWNHLFGDKLFLNLTGTFSRFFYQSRELVENATFQRTVLLNQDYFLYQYNSNNRDWALKLDFDYMPNPRHYVRFGANVIAHRFQPGAIVLDESVLLDSITEDSIEFLLDKSALFSNEFELYAEDEWKITSEITANLGGRLSFLQVQGSFRYYLQPRLSIQYRPVRSLALNLAVGRSVQPLHLLTNSGIGLPRDLWVTATKRIDPVNSVQIVGGAVWTPYPGWSVGLETYYKTMDNLLTFQEGSLAFIDATNWQNKVASGKGNASGVELLLKKEKGRLQGWLSYTLSSATRQFEDLNLGDPFPFKFDRRHNVNLLLARTFGRHWTISGSWSYATGNATTIPRTRYEYNQLNLLYADFPPQFPFALYVNDNGKRNDIRFPSYHRLDLGLQYDLQKEHLQHTFSLSIYNVYSRLNPFLYLLADRPNENGQLVPQYVQISLLPILPSLRYRIRL